MNIIHFEIDTQTKNQEYKKLMIEEKKQLKELQTKE